MNIKTARTGFWFVIISTLGGLGYELTALLELGKIIQPPLSLMYILAPSLLLALTFPSVIVCLQDFVPEERKVFARIGLNFILAYSIINSIVYFSQLTVVIPQMLQGNSDAVGLLLFEAGKFMYSINGLAYGLMSIGTLMTAFAFNPRGPHKWVFRTMFAHGLLAPFITGALFIPSFFAIGILWLITFPAMMFFIAKLFLSHNEQ